MKEVRLNIRVNEELLEIIKKQADHWGLSVSAYIKLLVRMDGNIIDGAKNFFKKC